MVQLECFPNASTLLIDVVVCHPSLIDSDHDHDGGTHQKDGQQRPLATLCSVRNPNLVFLVKLESSMELDEGDLVIPVSLYEEFSNEQLTQGGAATLNKAIQHSKCLALLVLITHTPVFAPEVTSTDTAAAINYPSLLPVCEKPVVVLFTVNAACLISHLLVTHISATFQSISLHENLVGQYAMPGCYIYIYVNSIYGKVKVLFYVESIKGVSDVPLLIDFAHFYEVRAVHATPATINTSQIVVPGILDLHIFTMDLWAGNFGRSQLCAFLLSGIKGSGKVLRFTDF